MLAQSGRVVHTFRGEVHLTGIQIYLGDDHTKAVPVLKAVEKVEI